MEKTKIEKQIEEDWNTDRIPKKIANLQYEITKKYPELYTSQDQRDIIKSYYELEALKTQKLHNQVIIGLQVVNLILLGILIYVTWIK